MTPPALKAMRVRERRLQVERDPPKLLAYPPFRVIALVLLVLVSPGSAWAIASIDSGAPPTVIGIDVSSITDARTPLTRQDGVAEVLMADVAAGISRRLTPARANLRWLGLSDLSDVLGIDPHALVPLGMTHALKIKLTPSGGSSGTRVEFRVRPLSPTSRAFVDVDTVFDGSCVLALRRAAETWLQENGFLTIPGMPQTADATGVDCDSLMSLANATLTRILGRRFDPSAEPYLLEVSNGLIGGVLATHPGLPAAEFERAAVLLRRYNLVRGERQTYYDEVSRLIESLGKTAAGVDSVRLSFLQAIVEFFDVQVRYEPGSRAWKSQILRKVLPRLNAATAATQLSFAPAWFWKGYILEQTGDFEEAFRAYTIARQINPISLDTILGLARVNGALRRWTEAQALVDLARSVRPKLETSYTAALLEWEQGRPNSALDEIVAFEDAHPDMQYPPDDIESLKSLILSDLGRTDEAELAVLRALGMGPSLLAEWRRALSAASANDTAESQMLFARIRQEVESSSDLFGSRTNHRAQLALLNAHLGDSDASLKLVGQLVMNASYRTPVRIAAASTYRLLGNASYASDALQWARANVLPGSLLQVSDRD